MSKFYTNIFKFGNEVHVRGYEMGRRVKFTVPYSPYLFLPKDGGEYSTLDGQDCVKKHFDSIREANEFIELYKDVKGFRYYGNTNYHYQYIYDNYPGEIDYDPKIIKVVTLDIEVGGDDIVEFPDIDDANQPITAITMHLNGKTASFGVKDYVVKHENSFYLKCDDEADMLDKFLQLWESDNWGPDIVTGWNVEFFDIPYIINRFKRVFGEKKAKRLSPWNRLDEKTVLMYGREQKSYNLPGITILDFLQLYKKFTFGNQESYKLDYIASVELGEQKLDYSEYSSLNDLYKRNFQKYMEYNIHDVILVQKLEDKLKFVEQVMALAYDAKVNYIDTMVTVKPWDVIITNYLMDQKIVVPQYDDNTIIKELVGGHVKEPIPGLYNWVVSFDLNSLYPHLIMQYNISPEMMVKRVAAWPTIDELLTGTINFEDIDPDKKYAFTANGCMFRKDKQGFLPALMEKMYNDRVKYKQMMLDAKKQYEEKPSEELTKLISRYHNMQMAKKIQLNSAYGALGNKYFRWFNFDLAESITTSGQLSIRWIEKKVNKFLNQHLQTEGVDYIIASDTDSLYVSMDTFVHKAIGESAFHDVNKQKKITKMLDRFCEQMIQPYLDACYQELADYMNAYAQKMKMKRETIASKGIWRKKKMYILNAWNVEGVQYNEPKLKINGIEAVRSSTPRACREAIKKSLSIIMNGTEQQLRDYVAKTKEEFMTLPYEDIAFPRGMNGLNEYTNEVTLYNKGTPIHVKGALIFNHMLKVKEVKSIPPIKDGDKIKFCYLKMPNPYGFTVIATADEIPPEFEIDKFIDREKQFDKGFIEPLKSISNLINWDLQTENTIDAFFA